MEANHILARNKSSWIAGIVFLFGLSLLLLTMALTKKGSDASVAPELFYYEQTQQFLELPQVLELSEDKWEKATKRNSGVSKNPYWFKANFKTPNPSLSYLMEINYGLLDHVDIWMIDADTQEIVATYTVGDAQNFEYRPVQYEQFLLPIPENIKRIDIYFKVSTKGPVKMPMRIWLDSDFLEYSGAHKLFIGLFFGYMMAMAVANLFIFATTKNKTAGIYTCYVFCFAMVVATLHGVSFRFFWPDNIWFQERAILFFACLTIALIIQLSVDILELKRTSKRLYLTLNAIKYVCFIMFFASSIFPYEIMIKGVLLMIALSAPFIVVSAVSLAINGSLVAQFFTAAWGVLLLSGLTTTFENLGLYEFPIDGSYLLMVGAITETMLLALALAMSFSSQYKETETARASAIESERQAILAKDDLLRVQEKAKQELEYRVEERTLELEIALRELSEANNELERLSAIDPLTGLMNRRYFDKRYIAEIRRSRRERTPLSVAVLDIDYFKKVNDEFGHLAGDECLKTFATILQQNIKRPADVICRYGGEEFVALLPNTDLSGAKKLMENIRKATEEHDTKYQSKHLSFTVSIGVTSRVVATEDEQKLLFGFADKLLYQAKQNGRNVVIAEDY